LLLAQHFRNILQEISRECWCAKLLSLKLFYIKNKLNSLQYLFLFLYKEKSVLVVTQVQRIVRSVILSHIAMA
jgi:hypothetical protein